MDPVMMIIASGIVILVVLMTFGTKSEEEIPKTETKVSEINELGSASKKLETRFIHNGFIVYSYRCRKAGEIAKKWAEQCKKALPLLKKSVPAMAVLLAMFICYSLYNKTSKSKANGYTRRAPMAYSGQVQQPRWVLTWVMPDGVDGINPHQRSISMDAIVTQNGPDVMELSTPGETKFYWDKREKYGEWHDAKGASGQWRLEGGRGNFKGEVSDNMGTFIPMRLERRS